MSQSRSTFEWLRQINVSPVSHSLFAPSPSTVDDQNENAAEANNCESLSIDYVDEICEGELQGLTRTIESLVSPQTSFLWPITAIV